MSNRKTLLSVLLFILGGITIDVLYQYDVITNATRDTLGIGLGSIIGLMAAPHLIRYVLSGDMWRGARGFIIGLPDLVLRMSNRNLTLLTGVAVVVLYFSGGWLLRVLQPYAVTVLVVIAAGLVVLVLWRLPRWQARGLPPGTDSLEVWKLENEFRRTVGQMLSATFLVGTLYFTWKQLMVTEDGKVTDRFSKSIDMLASERTSSRIGAIYALERVARDSSKDYESILEILTAYIREAATMKTGGPAPEAISTRKDTPAAQTTTVDAGTSPRPKEHVYYGEALPDVQAALTVVGRRTKDWTSEKQKIFLENCNLRKMVLVDGKFQGSVLMGSDLSEARLIRTDLRGAFLDRANLTKADLSHARLDEATLTAANLTGTNVNGVNFEGADLREADLTGIINYEAIPNAMGANIFGAKISTDVKQTLGRLGAVEMEDTEAWLKHLKQTIPFRTIYTSRD